MKKSTMLAVLLFALCLIVCQAKVSEAAPMGTALTYQGNLTDARRLVDGLYVAAPMGTAFTYKGNLTDAGRPVDGLYDFEFKLYDNPGPFAGHQVGRRIIINDLDVIDGHFVVELDFGPDIFTGYARWLETTVAQSDGSNPRTLTPREELTPTPYAIYAASAGGDNDWRVSGNNMYAIPSGNVGIGTTNPQSKLSVGGNGIANTGVYGSGSSYGVYGRGSSYGVYGSGSSVGVHGENSDSGSSGRLGFATYGVYGSGSIHGVYGSGSTYGVYGEDSDSGSSGRLGYGTYGGYFSGDGYFSGNVGIGTTTPSAKLDVEVSSGGTATIGSSSNSATGDYAIAMGYNTEASGDYSTAMGAATIASGFSSTAMGHDTTASGRSSTAMGYGTTASAYYSTAMGRDSTASAWDSTAMGYGTTASGSASTAMGSSTTASGDYSTAMGADTIASGYSSTAMGYATTASTWFSTAMGYGTTASGSESTAMGSSTTASGDYSTAMGRGIEASAHDTVGIGLDNTYRNITQPNTMAIMGGNVGIGTTSPASKLEVAGIVHSTSGGFKFPDGTIQTTAVSVSGVDWSSKTPYFASGQTKINSYSAVVNVSGSGYLMSIQQYHQAIGDYFGYLKIVIDGTTRYDGGFSKCSMGLDGYYSSPGMLSGLFRFNSSLQVYHRSSYYIRTTVAYVKD